MQLINYIHLNPLRAGKVQSLEQLKDWVWCGHSFLLGLKNAKGEKFQNRLECLRRFGDNESDAVKGYLQSLEKSCLGDDNKTAGKLPFKEAYEISGSCKGWPAVIGDPEFAKNAMEKYSRMCFQRKHRKSDYAYVLETISNKICTEHCITQDDLFKRGRKNKNSFARADFCYQSHLKELIPLSVIAGFLRTTISPIAVLVKKGDSVSKTASIIKST